MTDIPSAITKKLQTLAQIAAAKSGGGHFNITRLTILKELRTDREVAAKFALHIARMTQERMKAAKQRGYARLIADGVRAVTRHMKTPTEKTEERLWDLFTAAECRQRDLIQLERRVAG